MVLSVDFCFRNSDVYIPFLRIPIDTSEELETKILELIDYHIKNGDEIYYCNNYIEIDCDNGLRYLIFRRN